MSANAETSQPIPNSSQDISDGPTEPNTCTERALTKRQKKNRRHKRNVSNSQTIALTESGVSPQFAHKLKRKSRQIKRQIRRQFSEGLKSAKVATISGSTEERVRSRTQLSKAHKRAIVGLKTQKTAKSYRNKGLTEDSEITAEEVNEFKHKVVFG